MVSRVWIVWMSVTEIIDSSFFDWPLIEKASLMTPWGPLSSDEKFRSDPEALAVCFEPILSSE